MTPEDFVQTVPLPLLHIRPDNRIGAMNARAEALFGDDVRGRHFFTVLRQPALLDAVEEALKMPPGQAGEAPRHIRARYLVQDAGRELVFAATVTPLVRSAGVLVAFEDVTPVKEAGQMRADFVANVSHELRTPLTALSGFIETLRGPARDDAEARERFLAIMERETGRMNRLVQDLLSLSRVEDVERMRPTEQVDLAGIVTSVVAGLAPLAEGRGPGWGWRLSNISSTAIAGGCGSSARRGRAAVLRSRCPDRRTGRADREHLTAAGGRDIRVVFFRRFR